MDNYLLTPITFILSMKYSISNMKVAPNEGPFVISVEKINKIDFAENKKL